MFNDVQKVSLSSNAVVYYDERTSTVSYYQIVFPHGLDRMTISNDSVTDQLRYSFDGATLDGELKAGEVTTISVYEKPSLYVRGIVGGGTYRVWGY